MTALSKQSQEHSRSHAQGRGFLLVIVVTTTPLLGKAVRSYTTELILRSMILTLPRHCASIYTHRN